MLHEIKSLMSELEFEAFEVHALEKSEAESKAE